MSKEISTTEINELKNEIPSDNNDLIATYDEAENMNESINEKNHHSAVSTTILQCSQVVGYNNTATVIRYQLEVLYTMSVVYVSGTLSEWKTMTIDLDDLALVPGTRLVLKAVPNVHDEYYCYEFFEYVPKSNTVYYEYCHINYQYYPVYRGMITSPLSPPVLKCSGLLVDCTARVNTKYELRLAATGEKIYITSQKYDRGDLWVFSLADLSINPGTQLRVHAGVIAGKDSEPYVILEYDPTVSIDEDTPKFVLVGNAFYTAMLFQGVT